MSTASGGSLPGGPPDVSPGARGRPDGTRRPPGLERIAKTVSRRRAP